MAVITADPAIFEARTSSGASLSIEDDAADASVWLGFRVGGTVEWRQISEDDAPLTGSDIFALPMDLAYNQVKVQGHGAGKFVIGLGLDEA